MADTGRAQSPILSLAKGLSGLAVAAVLGLTAVLAWHSLTDLDIWFHLRAGQDLLQGGGFAQTNTYSFADPDHVWLNHEWLYQILTAWTAPATPLLQEQGFQGWNLMRLAMIMLLVAVLILGDGTWQRLKRRRAPLGTALVALVVLSGLLLLWPRFNLRPELLSYLLLILVVRGAEKFYRRPVPLQLWRDRTLWQLFALILIWAQCHGFAVIGAVVLLIAALLRPLDSESIGNRWQPMAIWAPVLLGLIALILTPNLWRGLVFPIRALGQLTSETADLSQTVSELVPLLETRNSLNLTLLGFKLSLVWGALFAVLGWGRVSVLRVVLFALTAAAALASQRSIALYGLAFILLHLGTHGGWPAPWIRQRLPIPALTSKQQAWCALGLAMLVCGAVGWAIPQVLANDFYLNEGVGRRFGTGATPATYPLAAAAALQRADAPDAFANLDAAAYLLGTTDSRLFIDGRTEAYPKERWAQYGQLRAGGPQAMNLLVSSRVPAVVLALSSGAFKPLAHDLMTSDRWHPIAADGGGVLFMLGQFTDSHNDRQVLTSGAEQLLAKQLSDKTRHADRCLAAADLFQLAGNTDAARSALLVGLQSRPEHPNLNHNLGNLLLAEGEFAKAQLHFERALQANGRLAGSAMNAGVCQLRQQHPEAAVTSFRRALKIDPTQLGGWVNLAVALRGLGQHQEAISALEKALALQPNNARLQGQLNQWRRVAP